MIERPEDETTPQEDEAPVAAPQEDAGGLDDGPDPDAPEPAAGPADLPSAEEAPAEESPADEDTEIEETADPSAPLAPEPGETSPPGTPATPPQQRRDRGRRSAPATGERVTVRAQAKYVRSSARKARLVCDLIRGKSVEDARAILSTTPRSVAKDWSKVLESAVANAENNHDLDGDELKIFAVHADEGPTLKRFRPRAMGRATRIRKRTAHLTIQLTPKES